MKTGAVVILFFLALASTVTGQTRTYYHKNPFQRTFTKVQKNPMFGHDSSALKSYLANKLHDQISETTGELKVSLLIDSTGNPLCQWIENYSNFNIKNKQLNLVFDEMLDWNPGIVAKHSVDCAIILTMVFNRQDLLVQYKLGTH